MREVQENLSYRGLSKLYITTLSVNERFAAIFKSENYLPCLVFVSKTLQSNILSILCNTVLISCKELFFIH